MIRRFEALHRKWTAWAMLPIGLTALLSIYRPSFLAGAERQTSDALLRLARRQPPDGRVVVVDIDERSLAAVGQWPWRRDVLGSLIAHIRARGASVVALDVLLAEPERANANGRSTDAALADVVRGGHVAIGYALTFDPDAPTRPECPRKG